MKPKGLSPGHPSYRPDIDGLRALAILSVIGFHAFPAWVPGGFVGVDVFFVISGFLISSILLSNLQDGRFSLLDFYARRIRRIFPALLIVLGAALFFGYLFLWPDEYRHLAKHVVGGAGFIDNFLLSGEAGYFDGRAETKPLLHLWSLGVEEQFYIFWPLMLWIGWKLKRHTGLAIILIIIASFTANMWLITKSPVLDFYSPFSRFWELLAGGALAWVVRKNDGCHFSQRIYECFAVLGLALITIADFAFNKNMFFPGWRALLPICGAVFIIAAGDKTFICRKILAHPFMIGIGLISYPLYLWHWPLLSFAQIMEGEASSRPIRAVMVALAFVLAWLTYQYVEKPIRKGGIQKKYIFVLLGLMAFIASMGVVIVVNGGVPGRFSENSQIASALDADRLIDQWQKNVRFGECHLQDPNDAQQAPECIEQARPLLLLWGDSHAASLYPGIRALQAKHDFGIAQLTQAGCPPLLDMPLLIFRPNCNDINQRILTQVGLLKPAVILLDSAWQHPDYPMDNTEIVQKFLKPWLKSKKYLHSQKSSL